MISVTKRRRRRRWRKRRGNTYGEDENMRKAGVITSLLVKARRSRQPGHMSSNYHGIIRFVCGRGQQQVFKLSLFYLCSLWLLSNPKQSAQQRQLQQLYSHAQQSQVIGPLLSPPASFLALSEPKMRIVPGKAAGTLTDYKQLILPYENYSGNLSQDMASSSYVIEQKRFLEAASSRCFASTILDDPRSVEPSFVVIRSRSEVRLNATVPAGEILRAGFEPNKRTTILVHGFTQSYPETTWLRRVRALFEQNLHIMQQQNLIIMDWGKASQGSYAQVAAMVSGMGSFLANFMMKLLELGTDRSRIHVVGHSLGAHLAGFAGKRIRPRIGRITALDAAGPCFGKFFLNSPMDRLSADDAYEVSVYHFDDAFLGLPGQHGQFDVYVNGGSSQPGCKDNVNAMVQALVTTIFRLNRVLSESHTRATEVFTLQLEPTGCQQVAYECRDYPAFSAGECGKCNEQNSQCFLINLDFQFAQPHDVPLRTSFPGKRLYLSTGPKYEQFCLLHYQVLVKFEPSPEMAQAAKRNKWKIQLELFPGSAGEMELADPSDQRARAAYTKRMNVTLSNQMAPNVFSALLLASEPRPVRFRSALLQVRASDNSLVQLAKLQRQQVGSGAANFKVFAIELNFMSHIDPHIRRSLSSRLCPTGMPAQQFPYYYYSSSAAYSSSSSPSSPMPSAAHSTTPLYSSSSSSSSSTPVYEFNSIASSTASSMAPSSSSPPASSMQFDSSWTHFEECFSPAQLV